MIQNTIVLGDWLEQHEQIDDNSVRLIVTSPPYFNAKTEYASFETYGVYLQYVAAWMRPMLRVLEPGGRLVWNIDDLLKSKEFKNCTTSQDSVLIARHIGFDVKTKVVWYDPANASGWFPGTYPNGPSVVINWACEDVWVFQKPDLRETHHPKYKPVPPELRKYDVMDKDFLIRFARNQVWEIPSVSAKRIGHPAPFPEELVEPCIRMWSRPGDIVLDPFLGSGTTVKSAIKWRRKWLGFERKKEYFELAQKEILKRQMECLHEQFFLPSVEPILDTSLPEEVQLALQGEIE